jgi:hypothetical protein
MILLYVKLDYSNNTNNNNVTTILPPTPPLLLTWQVQVVEETIIDKIKMRLL